MESIRKNRQLFIDKEFLATLALAKEGILHPVDKLMNKQEAKAVDETGYYKGKPFPFPFIIAPSGDKNKEVLTTAYQGEPLDFVVDGKIKGTIIVDEVFDLRPASIIDYLNLRRPIYEQTAAYGHFGRPDLDLPWEALTKVETLKQYL